MQNRSNLRTESNGTKKRTTKEKTKQLISILENQKELESDQPINIMMRSQQLLKLKTQEQKLIEGFTMKIKNK